MLADDRVSGTDEFAFAALLVLGAVTLAWWGFLAWLIWHVV
jgi:prepilin signal peptidase PulO-like enzyme (type II secretory pathway)